VGDVDVSLGSASKPSQFAGSLPSTTSRQSRRRPRRSVASRPSWCLPATAGVSCRPNRDAMGRAVL